MPQPRYKSRPPNCIITFKRNLATGTGAEDAFGNPILDHAGSETIALTANMNQDNTAPPEKLTMGNVSPARIWLSGYVYGVNGVDNVSAADIPEIATTAGAEGQLTWDSGFAEFEGGAFFVTRRHVTNQARTKKHRGGVTYQGYLRIQR